MMEFTLETTLFYILTAISVYSAVMMITRKSPINSALFLIMNFITVAGIYLLLRAQFVAVIQIIVYMGAIMILFLFVIMLLNLHDLSNLKEEFTYKKMSAALLSILLFALLGYTVYFGFMDKYSAMSDASLELGTAQTLGRELVMNYTLPFEIAGFLLLAAVVGAVILAKKKLN